MKCTLIDYGTGNLQSVQNALKHLGHQVFRTNNATDIGKNDVLIFPGQGAFGPAMYQLEKMNIIQKLTDYVNAEKPFIGICLGFQLLFEKSQESKSRQGLSCFEGTFERFINPKYAVPHMGWNTIKATNTKTILDQFNNERFYFVHSYYLPENNEKNTAKTNYGVSFISAMATKTQLITQFHPEKSGNVGLELLNQYFKSL